MKIRWKKPRDWPAARVLCPLLAFGLALGMVLSAPGLDGEARAVELDKSCSLTVHPVAEGSEYTEDLATADVAVDLYQIAAAEADPGYDTYKYQFKDGYTSLDYSTDITNEGWAALAQQAAQIALDPEAPKTPDKALEPVNAPITGLESGLYLIIARGKDIADYAVWNEEEGKKTVATVAWSRDYEYTFLPSLISLPTKQAVDGSISTAGPGEWIYDASVSLKPEREHRFGPLEITKNLRNYEGSEPATFVFEVVARFGEEVVYSDVVSMTFTKAGPQSILIENIPVGAQVTVTEVYSGSVYQAVSDVTGTAVISAEEIAGVLFINDYTWTDRGGGAITNYFEYGEDGSWNWQQFPDTQPGPAPQPEEGGQTS